MTNQKCNDCGIYKIINFRSTSRFVQEIINKYNFYLCRKCRKRFLETQIEIRADLEASSK